MMVSAIVLICQLQNLFMYKQSQQVITILFTVLSFFVFYSYLGPGRKYKMVETSQ